MSSKLWLRTFQLLLEHHGAQSWWPADSPFEVMVGAVLTQNTAWINVEKAIANLRAADALNCAAILGLGDAALAELIRPAGYYNVKTRRLKALCHFLDRRGVAGRPEALSGQEPPSALRSALLAVHGVGEETADSILLYALGHPSFVVDAYTRRAFVRLGLVGEDAGYAEIQAAFERHLPRDAALYNEYHALIVRLGKEHCRPRPRCPGCPLHAICPSADGSAHVAGTTTEVL